MRNKKSLIIVGVVALVLIAAGRALVALETRPQPREAGVVVKNLRTLVVSSCGVQFSVPKGWTAVYSNANQAGLVPNDAVTQYRKEEADDLANGNDYPPSEDVPIDYGSISIFPFPIDIKNDLNVNYAQLPLTDMAAELRPSGVHTPYTVHGISGILIKDTDISDSSLGLPNYEFFFRVKSQSCSLNIESGHLEKYATGFWEALNSMELLRE